MARFEFKPDEKKSGRNQNIGSRVESACKQVDLPFTDQVSLLYCKAFTVDDGHVSDQEIAVLILTRRRGESVTIGDDVSISILGIKGNQVRVGINAPKEVPVHREEIYQKIQHEDA